MKLTVGILSIVMLLVPEAGVTSPIQRPLVSLESSGNTIYVAERRHVRRPAGRPNAVRRDVRRSRPAGGREIRRGAPAVRRNNVIRNNTVVRNRAVVVRPVRPWVRRPYYGRVVAGVALGTVIAASTLPRAPSSELCWYWSNSSQTRGYWDYCVQR